ncbi:DUF3592 domain-containing protein [Bergeyella sp. RCAD1439]|uniref:DUF3592 domain-containing protein n=1 Tax=Bergeyella anatis TaxID=3113737 RepID=UPI002E187F1B|nr:DUF3592 domain-containing protein [Bergeyella sp. RCAD1439]
MEKELVFIWLCVGLVFFVGGIIMLVRLNKKMKKYIRTIGVISSKQKKIYDISVGEIADVYFEYRVRYYVQKNEIDGISDFKVQKELNIGDKVEIYYNPSNVEEFMMFPVQERLMYTIFIIIGFLSFIIFWWVVYQNQ